MNNKEVYVLLETTPDYISTAVYKERDEAILALKEVAEENNMEYHEGDSEADGGEIYAEVRTETLN